MGVLTVLSNIANIFNGAEKAGEMMLKGVRLKSVSTQENQSAWLMNNEEVF